MAVAARVAREGLLLRLEETAARSGVRPSPRSTSCFAAGLRDAFSTMPIVLATKRSRCSAVASAPIARTQVLTPLASTASEVSSCKSSTAPNTTPVSRSALLLSGLQAAQLKRTPATRPRSKGPASTCWRSSPSKDRACTGSSPPRLIVSTSPSRMASAHFGSAAALSSAPAAGSRTEGVAVERHESSAGIPPASSNSSHAGWCAVALSSATAAAAAVSLSSDSRISTNGATPLASTRACRPTSSTRMDASAPAAKPDTGDVSSSATSDATASASTA
mmetsp:Transcript_48780/g.161622  ORF Transcript_48780/g.161622 Transcript_48780/m.161622 type:complete len:277 (+) Transcript_48780:571-1401(+)